MPVEIPPQPGQKAWIKDRSPFPLPEPWRDRQQVLVVKVAGNHVTVRELGGAREIELKYCAVDAGWLFTLRGGVQVHESHPAALTALKACVNAGITSPHDAVRLGARRWAWVLERNGVMVELPPEPKQEPWVNDPERGLFPPGSLTRASGDESANLRPREAVPRTS